MKPRAGDSECAVDATLDDDSAMKWTLLTVSLGRTK